MSDSQPQEALEGQRKDGTLQPQPSSEVHQKLFRKILDRWGHYCDLVANGEEAVVAYKKGHQTYQCILMRSHMTVMDGMEATKLIRAFEEENGLEKACIVALTNWPLLQDKDRLQKLGFTAAIQIIAFSPKELNGLLEELGLLREV
ncbi:hypothetical protein KVR01_006975 [Diaporthe batatas]|uniref:uncharacterized protein n=1 Tax=Diaporthe batatas TaxID=748121 RepID=UPI001D039957|nr:uncharacterized protein KVR01_006975 [Diaporthe batatas]KAG8163678.1 hypothetical protein KVR01_006975 [Diaporthe batatas]